MKKIQVSLLALLVSLGLLTSSNAAVNSVGDPGRSWAQPNDWSLGEHIQQFIDSPPNEMVSYLVRSQFSYLAESDPTCESISDPDCAGQELNYSAVLPRCLSEVDSNCTSDFGIIDESGVKRSANFQRYFPERAQNQFKGDSVMGVPDGVAGSLFSLPQAPHDGGDKYHLAVVLSGGVSASGVVTSPTFEVRIHPVQLETSAYLTSSGDQRDAGWAEITDKNTGKVRWGIQGVGYDGTQYCVASSWREKLCAQKYAFPADLKFYVTVRTSQEPGGWMHGRISSPDIQISKGSRFSTIELSGYPIAVPTIYKKYRYTEMPSDLKKWYDVKRGGYIPSCGNGEDYCAGGRSGPSPDPLNRNVIISPAPWDPFGMDQFKLWIPYVDDKATALPSFWSVRSLSVAEMENASACFSDKSKITGIVTTNSTQYSAGPPKFDKSEGTLGYQVAAPHFGTKGEVFKGSYDLVMRSEVARCVYGFSKAPIQASLSITSSDGSQQVATTVIGERDGWLYLTAKNFEFSAPVIKAKLTQEGPAPAPTATSAGTPSQIQKPKTKMTITCVRGSSKKKVTAVKPTCPKGYKKVVR